MAKVGDFGQAVSVSIQIPTRMSGRLQSDKPIYQPGQILHVRATIMDTQDRAAEGAKVILHVQDEMVSACTPST